METQIREFRAEARFQRVSPQKARLVLDLIKGRGVEDALNTVMFAKKAVAPLVEKVLRSAVQNANHLSQEQDLDVDLDNLYVKSAVANEGPRMKRIRPAPMGRAYRYQRRLSHIVIAVAERAQANGLVHRVEDESAEQPVQAAGKKSAKKKAPAKRAAHKQAKKATAHKPAAGSKKKSAAKKSAKKK
ncbi:MAG TPA: 50S ribosomal protein L22 [Acidobacteriaceae bacterium]|jgi:large subunit ribosomal protein L22|nr:50S ribosomal protein L22 [Acidobacteriaceae bacterium]